MKLIGCHVSGFGKIINQDYTFSDGLNARLEENGWGKTTLAVFIKAMFFGMEYNRKKKLSEREHYKPWDSAVYGGNLTFESNGKRYRIERTFAKRDKEDTFALFNADTNTASEDYSDNIGEELFLVDRDAFEKSIFIMQGNLATAKSDSLNAKMGNLAAAKGDISNFDDAIERLEEARGIYSRKGTVNPGKLATIRKEIRSCTEAKEKLPALEEGIVKQRSMLEEKRRHLHILEAKKRRLADLIAKQSRREQELGVYREKKNVFDKLNEEYSELSSFFSQGLPDPRDIEIFDDMERRMEMDKNERLHLADNMPEPSDAERLRALFAEKPVNEEALEEYEGLAAQILNLRVESEHAQMSDEDREQLSELKVVFNKHLPTEEELSDAEEQAAQLTQMEGQVHELEKRYDDLAEKYHAEEESKYVGGPSAFVFAMIAAAVIVAGGILLLVFTGESGRPAGAICLIVGVIIAGVSLLMRSRTNKMLAARSNHRREELADAQNDLAEAKEAYAYTQDELHRFLSDYLFSPTNSYIQMVGEIRRKSDLYDRLREQEKKYTGQTADVAEELSVLQVRLYTALAPYAEVYGIDLYATHEEQELIRKLRDDLSAWNAWSDAKEKTEHLQKEEAELKGEIFGYLRMFHTPVGSDLKELLLDVRNKNDRYLTLGENIKELAKEIGEFESIHRVDEDTASVEKLQHEQAVVDEDIAEYTNLIAKDKEILSDLTDEREVYEEQSETLASLKDREKQYEDRVAVFDQTIRFLREARERFLQKYMGPLQRGLGRYMKRITGETAQIGDFTLDMDLKVVLNHNGATKERDYLSAGYRDLTAVCARLALIDVLYTKEKPPVIMDDPFANLDEDKGKLAISLLKEISEDRQILYFTCHESRMA